MISCKHCSTPNSLDSTFCRKCGTEVSEIEVTEARAKLDVLAAEGNSAFNEGRTDEALAVAESVLGADPNSVPALWLKAICHERRDEIAEALECADRIVELNPDSELDRIRRNQLRTKLSASLQVYERPDRRMALVGAVAASVLVLCVGALAASMMRDKPKTDGMVASNTGQPQQQTQLNNLVDPNAGQTNNGTTGGTTGTPGTTGGPPPQQTSPPGTTGGFTQGDVGPLRDNVESGTPTRPNNSYKAPDLGQVPEVQGNGGAVLVDPNSLKVEPVTPTVPNVQKQGPDPDDPRTDPQAVAGTQQTTESVGSIDISVRNGSTVKSAPGSDSGNGAQARMITANQAYLVGDYVKAANLFEQAIRSGGDPITLNQRLGQSYERLGRTGEAVDAYKRAVQAGESALNTGKGNPDRIRSAVESAQQALRKLGG